MTQKIKAIILITLIFLLTISVGAYFFQKKNDKNIPSENSQQSSLKSGKASDVKVDYQENAKLIKESLLEGKLISIAEKEIVVENITNKSLIPVKIEIYTPIFVDGESDLKDLSFLKRGSFLKISMDQNNNALYITIKK
jgi:hypothetical protein